MKPLQMQATKINNNVGYCPLFSPLIIGTDNPFNIDALDNKSYSSAANYTDKDADYKANAHATDNKSIRYGVNYLQTLHP